MAGKNLVLFSISTLRKCFCYKYKETNQQTDKWREPPAIEFITTVIVTAKTRNVL